MKSYVQSHLKDMNRQVVYKLVKERQMTSKAEISRLTGISSPTVIKIVNFLLEKKLLIEVGEGENSIGRKPHMVTLNKDWGYVAVFFLEGDFLSMGIVDILGNVLNRKQLRVTPDIDIIFDQISNVFVPELLEDSGIDLPQLFGIGIALPVIYDKNKQTISGSPLVADQEEYSIGDKISMLEKKFDVTVCVENDANAQVLGEFEFSGYQPKDDLLFVSLGTGMGAGVILSGKLRRGAHNMCGEIGYLSFMEGYVSDKKEPGYMEVGIGYKNLQEKYGLEVTETNFIIPEQVRTRMVQYVASTMALCISNIAVFLDCDNIVLGGKVIEMLGMPVVEQINHNLEDSCICDIKVKMERSENVGMIGIASLVTEKKIVGILTEE